MTSLKGEKVMPEATETKLELVKDWSQAPDGTSSQLDLTEDAWQFGAPPPRGIYDLKLFPAKECVKWGLQDPKDKNSIYYLIQMECKVVSDNEDYDGVPVFGNVSTRIFRGKSISTAAGLLVKLSYKVDNPITDKKLAMMTELALKKERVIKSELDWRGAYSYKDAKTGQDVWENVFNHYEEFPQDPDKPGTRKHIVTVANKVGGVAEVRAQLRIVRFFGKDDKLPVIVSGTTLVSGPRSLITPPQPHPYSLEQVIQPSTQVVQNSPQMQTPQPQFVQPIQPMLNPMTAQPTPIINAVPSPMSGGELELLLEI